MPRIIDTMKLLGYSPSEKGLCFGIATMSAQANLRRENHTFVNRITKIHNSSVNDIKLIKKDKDFIEDKLQLQYFFDELSIYHGSNSVNQDFKKIFPKFNQSIKNLKTISLESDNLEEEYSLPEVRKIFINAFTGDDLLQFAKELKVFLKGEPFSLILTDPFEGHATHLGFDGEKWVSTNHDTIQYVENSRRGLRGAIQNAFGKNDLNDAVVFSINVALQNTSKTQLTKFKDYNFNLEKQKTDKKFIASLLLSCVLARNTTLLKKLLNDIKNLPINDLIEIINFKNKLYMSSIYCAAQDDYTDIIEILLDFIKELKMDHSTKLNMLNSRFEIGSSPLYIAAQNENLNIVKLLIKAVNQLNVSDSAKANFFKAEFRKSHSSLKEREGSALFTVAKNGDVQIFKILIDAICSLKINNADKIACFTSLLYEQLSLLHVAAECGHAKLVKLLLDTIQELDTNQNIYTRWITAKYQNKESALHFAVQNGHTKVVEVLLAAIKKLNLSNEEKVDAILSKTSGGHSTLLSAERFVCKGFGCKEFGYEPVLNMLLQAVEELEDDENAKIDWTRL